MSNVKIVCLALLLIATASAAFANDGQLDTSWGVVNSGTTEINFFSGGQKLSSVAWAVAAEPDGKVVVAGDVTSTRGDSDIGVARLMPNGLADNSFGNGGIVITDIDPSFHSGDHARGVVIQPDGKIVVVGWASEGTPQEVFVARYNTNGSLDTSFNNGGTRPGIYTAFFLGATTKAELWAVALQSNGGIICGGWTNINGNGDFLLMRLLSNGTVDTSFGSQGVTITDFQSGSADYIDALAIAQDGTIYAGGHSRAGSGGDNYAIASYTSQGVLGGKVYSDYAGMNDVAAAIGLEPDGKIITAGISNTALGSDLSYFRINPNGSPDGSFGPGSPAGWALGGLLSSGSSARGLVVQPDGKIVAAGYLTYNGNYRLVVERLNTDGSADNSFGTQGVTVVASSNHDVLGRAITFAPNGELFVAGYGDDIGHSEMEVLKFTDSEGTGANTGSGVCVADSTHLCLTGNRFRVSVEWYDYNNNNVAAAAHAVPFAGETGFFYFKNSSNLELMVKVHNACIPYTHYWFFAAATTDVGYTISVTDTQTGKTEQYSNSAHVLSPAVNDETSFDSCP